MAVKIVAELYHSSMLADLLQNGEVVSHSFVVGEFACGNLRNRVLGAMMDKP